MTPFGALFAALAAAIIQGLWGSPYASAYTVDRSSSLHTAILAAVRVIVVLTWAFVAGGLASAVVAWARRERPRWLPFLGLFTTALLVGLFDHFAAPN